MPAIQSILSIVDLSFLNLQILKLAPQDVLKYALFEIKRQLGFGLVLKYALFYKSAFLQKSIFYFTSGAFMLIDYQQLKAAIINNSDNSPFTAKAYLALGDGKIHFVIEDDEFDFHEDEVPDDIDDVSKYLLLPAMNQLVEDGKLALEFAEQKLPDRFDTLRNFLRSSGGMDKFNKLIASLNATGAWQEFKEAAYKKAVEQWAQSANVKIG